jgi:hypothetical protein
MGKQSKNMENITIKKDSLQAILKKTDANYCGLKVEKDILSIKHSKLQKNYKNMEEILLKHQKEVEKLKMDNANAYQV